MTPYAYYASFCHLVDSTIQFGLMLMDLDPNRIRCLVRFYENVVADFWNSAENESQTKVSQNQEAL